MRLSHIRKGIEGAIPTMLAWSKYLPPDPVSFVLSNPLMRPAQVPNEFRRFGEIASTVNAKTVLEIGTLRGGTLFVLCRLADPSATVVSIDLPNGPYGGGYNSVQAALYRRFTSSQQSIHLLRADSHLESTKEAVRKIAPQLDLLFIDGDHSYAGVKRDFDLYSPLVRTGGMVVLHDIAPHDMSKFPSEETCGVDRFWREISPRYPHLEIIDNPEQGWAGIGIMTV